MSPSTSKTESRKNSNWLNLLEWVLLSILLRWQVIEPRWIRSGSMLPTLELQDRILVEKISPRLRRLQKSHLNHEDMVIFYPPEKLVEAGYDPDSALIKRLIGLPGDQIEVSNGQILVNGKVLTEPWREEPINYEMGPITVTKNHLWVALKSGQQINRLM